MRMAEPTGLEPATSDVTGRRSNQLNYDSALSNRTTLSPALLIVSSLGAINSSAVKKTGVTLKILDRLLTWVIEGRDQRPNQRDQWWMGTEGLEPPASTL